MDGAIWQIVPGKNKINQAEELLHLIHAFLFKNYLEIPSFAGAMNPLPSKY
jgi:hypothetical protein